LEDAFAVLRLAYLRYHDLHLESLRESTSPVRA